jgi:hypothetical protein
VRATVLKTVEIHSTSVAKYSHKTNDTWYLVPGTWYLVPST